MGINARVGAYVCKYEAACVCIRILEICGMKEWCCSSMSKQIVLVFVNTMGYMCARGDKKFADMRILDVIY